MRPVWKDKVQAHARSRRRRHVRWLAAAVVLFAIGGVALWQQIDSSAPAIATVESLTGHVRNSTLDRVVEVGDFVAAGTRLETGSGGATLHLAETISVRIDKHSSLRFESPSALTLEAGAVYLDTGPEETHTVQVQTPFGVARDIGTQFEVRLLEDALQVQVREGRVDVEQGPAHHEVAAGTRATFRGGEVRHQDLSAHAAEWSWAVARAPAFELSGRPLNEVLAWVSRETGWQIVFVDPAVEREVGEQLIQGSIGGLRPDQAAGAVLPAFDLRHRLEDGILRIE